MARLNIDDRLYTDQRFLDLVQKIGSGQAIGELVRCWIAGQQFWKHGDLIPLEVWRKQRLCDAIIDVGLAELRETGVYVRGSKDYFDWLSKAVESGKRGGLASAESRRNDSSNLESRDPVGTLKGFQPSYSSSPSCSKESLNSKELSPRSRKSAPSIQTYRMITKEDFVAGMGAFLTDWSELYPDKDYLNREVAKGILWLKANPRKNTKTIRGWQQFWSGWFDRGWDKSRTALTSNSTRTASSNDWELTAARVLKSLLNRGTGSRAAQEIEADLGAELYKIALAAGTQKIRSVPPGAFQHKNIAEMLKTASALTKGEK